MPTQRYYEWQWKVIKVVVLIAALGLALVYLARHPEDWFPFPTNFGQ